MGGLMPRRASRRYAQAIFELATRDDKIDAWRHELGLACEMASQAGVARAVDSPAVPFAERRAILTRLLGAHVSHQVLNLCLLLAERSRFSIMPEVSREYDDLLRQSRGIVAVTVIAPQPLTEMELAAVQTRVEQLAGAQVELYQEVDAALIGGICVRIGDLQIDASVANRLRRLRQDLITGAS
jgi:F-type H+-transporting ATPase subunit delta